MHPKLRRVISALAVLALIWLGSPAAAQEEELSPADGPVGLASAALEAQQAGDYAGAVQLYSEAIAQFEAQADSFSAAECARELLVCYTRLGNLDAATAAARRSCDFYLAAGLPANAAQVCATLASVRRAHGDYSGATAAQIEALGFYEESGDVAGQASTFLSLGIIADLQDELESAAQNFAAARELYRAIGDNANTALCFSNEGYALSRLGRTTEALEAYQQCLFLYHDLGLESELADAHAQRGQAYENIADWERALADYTSALALLDRIGEPLEQAECHRNMGHVLFSINSPSAARMHFEEAWRLFEAGQAEQELEELLPELTALLEEIGDDEAAAAFRERLENLSAANGQSENPAGY